jgi:hypothetical protein
MSRPFIAALAAALTALAIAALPAQAKKFNPNCASVRINQDHRLDRHALFGAFHIKRLGTSCKTARKVAYRYVHDPKAVRRVTHILRFTCTNHSTDYQEVKVTCRKTKARITFTYVVPGD